MSDKYKVGMKIEDSGITKEVGIIIDIRENEVKIKWIGANVHYSGWYSCQIIDNSCRILTPLEHLI